MTPQSGAVPRHGSTPAVLSVNVGVARPKASRRGMTGIAKEPVLEAQVRAPGPRTGGLGSGLVGDFIGDAKHHGGDLQAVYAVAREELDHWERALDRVLPSGSFGENLTTSGLAVDDALVGERWQVGEGPEAAVLRVTVPRIPCNTFKAWIQESGWLKTFTAHGRPGTYLSVERPGLVRPGDPITVLERPAHEVSVATLFLALTTRPDLAPKALTAAAYLDDEGIGMLQRRQTYVLG